MPFLKIFIKFTFLSTLVIPAFATTVVQMTSEELASKANYIAYGRVGARSYVTNNALGLQWEVARFQVQKIYKNACDFNIGSSSEIHVSTMQALNPVQEIGMKIHGGPKLPEDADMILFLECPQRFDSSPSPIYVFSVLTLSQGTRYVFSDDLGVKRVSQLEPEVYRIKVNVGEKTHSIFDRRSDGSKTNAQSSGSTRRFIQREWKLDEFEAMIQSQN